MKINKYGYKMVGLKKASGETKDYGDFSGSYVEIFYDRRTGEIWTRYQYSIGHNWETKYHNSDIIKVCTTSKHLTMQQIADEIKKRLENELDTFSDELEECEK